MGGAGVQRVIIPHPGVRPGQPGSQISVPLATLQSLQVGDWSSVQIQASDWSIIYIPISHSRLAKESPLALLVISLSRQSQVCVI